VDGEREREHRIAGALPGRHDTVLDLDVPVAAAGARHVILHAEVLRHGGTFRLLHRIARRKELLEELLRGDALGDCLLLGHEFDPPRCPERRPGMRMYALTAIPREPAAIAAGP